MKKLKMIFKGGKVKVEAEGFIGPECVEVTDKILSAIGTLEERRYKPEYYGIETKAIAYEEE